MEQRCLFIDDEPEEVESVLENLIDIGQSNGLRIKCDLLGLTGEFYNASNDFDSEMIKAKLHGDFLGKKKYDLVACDYDIEDDHLTGLDIVKLVREKNRNCAVIIYSGNLKKIATYIASTDDKTERFRKIKLIVNARISEFIDRDNEYESQLINILKKRIPLEVTIEKKLREYGDMIFEHGYDMFIGKSLSEIANEINRETHHGILFKREIIERGISHMIKLNNPE